MGDREGKWMIRVGALLIIMGIWMSDHGMTPAGALAYALMGVLTMAFAPFYMLRYGVTDAAGAIITWSTCPTCEGRGRIRT